MKSAEQHKEKLMHDLTQVIKDAEELLKNSEQQGSAGFQSAKTKIEHTIKNAKAEIERIEDMVVTKAKDAAYATDVYVKDNPWQSAGIAAGVGLLIGLLISRK